jgi:hypothetical protein
MITERDSICCGTALGFFGSSNRPRWKGEMKRGVKVRGKGAIFYFPFIILTASDPT